MGLGRWRLQRRRRRARTPHENITRREIRQFSRSFDRDVVGWLNPVALPIQARATHHWLLALAFVIALGAVFAATTLAALWFPPVVAGAVPTLGLAAGALALVITRARSHHDRHTGAVRPSGYAKATDETTDL